MRKIKYFVILKKLHIATLQKESGVKCSTPSDDFIRVMRELGMLISQFVNIKNTEYRYAPRRLRYNLFVN